MDAYSGYNQISMDKDDKNHSSFITEGANYMYNVMSFGLWNTGATYQRMINKVFRNEIWDMLKVYMDDMIVKSTKEYQHKVHLEPIFTRVHQYNMCLNPDKCTFRVKAGKFLWFYLIERVIKAILDKCRDILAM